MPPLVSACRWRLRLFGFVPEVIAIASIQKNEPFYGEVDILGKPYITGYEPIRDQSKNVFGIYYVGYLK